MRRGVALLLLVVFFVSAKQVSAQEPLKVLGKTAPEWIELLQTDANPQKRRAAIIALGVFGPAERGVVDGLIHALKNDKDEEIREAAALTLAEMGVHAKSAVTPLENALAKDKSPKVRTAAAKALGGEFIPYSKSAIPTLGEALKDSDPDTRARAALTLKEHGADARDVMNIVLATAKNTKMDRFTRMYCAQILSRFKEDGSKIIPVYIAILREKDADSGLKQVVVDGLGEFGKEAVSGTDELVAVLEDISAPLLLRRSAAVSLVEVEADCKKVWPTVKKIMKSQANELRSQAARLAGKTCKNEPEAVDALIELCKDRNQDVQIAAIQELGEFGPAARKAETTLTNLIRNAPRRSIREEAQIALKKIQGN